MATETLASVPEMLQADVAALQTDMAVIKGQLPHLATKGGMEQLQAHFEGQLPHLATKADMERGFRQMTWTFVATLLVGLTALAGLIVALQIFS